MSERCLFGGSHLPLVVIGLVVIAEQVQHSVREQVRQLSLKRVTVFDRLTLRSLERDGNVS